MADNLNLFNSRDPKANDSSYDRIARIWSNPEMESIIPLYLGVLFYNQLFWKNFRRKGIPHIPAENRRILMALYFLDRPLSYSELIKCSTYDYNQKFEKCLKECLAASYISCPGKGRYEISFKGLLWCRQVLKSLEDVLEASEKGKIFTSLLLELKK